MSVARSAGATARQAGKAALAAATAASVSSTPARGTSAITCCGRGLDDLDHATTSFVDAAVSAASTGLRRSSSACQRIPSAQRLVGISIASTVSPGSAQPVATSPSPSRSTPWWWCERTETRSAPTARAASEPGSRRTSWSEKVPGRVQVKLGVGDVLVERAAAGDVEQLHPAADAEHRQVALERAAREGELEAVALGPGALRVRVGLGAVAGRVDVRAAGEDEPVEQVEQLLGRLGDLVVGRQDQRQPARLGDAARVRALRDVDLDVAPDGPVRALDHRADPDDRPATRSESSRSRGIAPSR